MASPPRRRRRAYYPVDAFPEIVGVQAHWRTIRDEAGHALDTIGRQLGRGPEESWILPLVPEAEDRYQFPEALYASARALAPETMRLVGAVPYVVAYAFSQLVPGKHIALHTHWNPYLNAILCLRDGGGKSHILVDGERHDFHDGNLMVFDYTLPHEAKNEGTEPRHVMLMIIDRELRAARS